MDVIDYRLCGRCGTWHPLEDFGFRDRAQTRRQFWCAQCLVEYKRVWYQRHRARHIEHVRVARISVNAENRARLQAFKAQHPCVDCGEADPVVLEFGRMRDKRWDISDMAGSGFSWSTIEAELAKCQIRCANCHRRKTIAQRNGRWKGLSEEVAAYRCRDNWIAWAVSSVG